jgi:hypothetical protein
MKKPVPMRPPRGGGFFRHILDGRARDAYSADMRRWRQQQQPPPEPQTQPPIEQRSAPAPSPVRQQVRRRRRGRRNRKQAAQAPLTQGSGPGQKFSPVWLKVAPHFDVLVKKKGKNGGPFVSLGRARDGVLLFMEKEKFAKMHPRTIERWIRKHRPNWVREA